MITIGITGGIGSGKSVICKLLNSMGYPVYYADAESKRLTNTHPKIKKDLIALFGEKIFTDNQINKKMLAERIFNNSETLIKVNNIIHPIVKEDVEKWVKKQKSPLCIVEAAILFESGLYQELDKKILVTAPIDIRIKRVKLRDKLTEEEIKSRINNQMSDEDKIKLADYVIVNDEKTAVIPQVNRIIQKLI